METDRFEFDLTLDAWVFTLALGIAAGVALAGAVGLAREWRGGKRWSWAAWIVAGGGAFVLVAAMPVDRLPVNYLPLQLKPFLSKAAVAIALNAAFAIGAALGAAAVLGAGMLARLRSIPPVATAGLQVALAGFALLGALAWVRTEATPGRHPHGTIAADAVTATLLVDASMATGLAVGPSGELVYVELQGGALHLRGETSVDVPLGIPEGSQSLHIALHPNWPEEPYVYVTVDRPAAEGPEMEVLLVRTDGREEVTRLVTGLPMTVPRDGNHFGSALAVCGDHLYVSVGDADTVLVDPQLRLRARAQTLETAAGKILRYRIDGAALQQDGVLDGDHPVFALGFRNPFGMACDAEAQLPVVAENGVNSNDQVRVVTAGSNHEWPFSHTRDLLGEPLFDTGNMTIAPTGIGVREGERGKEVVLSAFNSGGVYVLHVDDDGVVREPPVLVHEFEYGLIALSLDANGCIFVADPFAIYRLEEERCR